MPFQYSDPAKILRLRLEYFVTLLHPTRHFESREGPGDKVDLQLFSSGAPVGLSCVKFLTYLFTGFFFALTIYQWTNVEER